MLDGITFSGAHPCLFLSHMFSITPGVHRTDSCCNSMRTQRGGLRGGGIVPGHLSDRGESFGPRRAQLLLCTCQSSCDTDSLSGDSGDASRGERGERSSVLPPHPPPAGDSPPYGLRKKLHITMRRAEQLATATAATATQQSSGLGRIRTMAPQKPSATLQEQPGQH